MSSSSCPVNSPIMPPGSQGSHIHCPPLPQPALHQNSPSPVPSRTPTPHHTPPSIGAQQPPATAIPAPVPTPPAMPPGPQSQALHPPPRQTPTPPPTQLPPQVQPSLPAAASADQPQQQPLSQQSTSASVPTPTAPLLPPQPATPVSRLGFGRNWFRCTVVLKYFCAVLILLSTVSSLVVCPARLDSTFFSFLLSLPFLNFFFLL